MQGDITLPRPRLVVSYTCFRISKILSLHVESSRSRDQLNAFMRLTRLLSKIAFSLTYTYYSRYMIHTAVGVSVMGT
jgi:hypothetical protein